MTLDQLRLALERILRSYGIDDEDFLDELVSIADHHAAEGAAAAASEAETTPAPDPLSANQGDGAT